jgi:hypothetical protein
MRMTAGLMALAVSYACCLDAAVSCKFLYAQQTPLNETADPSSGRAGQITAYSSFVDVCSAFVVGYRNIGGQMFPKRGHFAGKCDNNSTPILFGVTQENEKNNHAGSANYDPNIVAYMGDVDVETDLGRWIDAKFTEAGPNTVLTMSLDTVNFHQTNVTGWPLQFGHLFFGANDLSVRSPLDRLIFIDFDIRVDTDQVRPELYPGYSGHRIMVGAKVEWDETTPRTNKAHYLEIDLIETNGYSAPYHDPERPLCKDVSYDRCFYSENGQYAEGRDLDYHKTLGNPPLATNSNQWTHVHLPVTELCKNLHWVSPPTSWGSAQVTGLYIGVESEGAAQAKIELKHYQVSASNKS